MIVVEINAEVVRRLVAGDKGPVRDVVLLNAGAALAAYDPEPGTVTSRIAAGMERAAQAIDSGAAQATLDRWIAACASA